MSVHAIVAVSLYGAALAVIVAGGVRRRRSGAPPLRVSASHRFGAAVLALALVLFGLFTFPVAVVWSLGSWGLGGLLPLAVGVAGATWLREIIRSTQSLAAGADHVAERANASPG